MKKNQELIHFRKLARSILPGHFLSMGVDPTGLEFQGFRAYEPGDSVETIDWLASEFTYPRETLMRLGERRRNIIPACMIDATRSMEPWRDVVPLIWEALFEETTEAGHQALCLLLGASPKTMAPPNVGGMKLSLLAEKLRAVPFSEGRVDLNRAFQFLLSRNRGLSQVAVFVSDFLFPADYRESLLKFRKAGNEVAFLILNGGAGENPAPPRGAFVSAVDSESGEETFITSMRPSREILGPHIAMLAECGAGWAILDRAGIRDEGLEEKLREAFGYGEKRKEEMR